MTTIRLVSQTCSIHVAYIQLGRAIEIGAVREGHSGSRNDAELFCLTASNWESAEHVDLDILVDLDVRLFSDFKWWIKVNSLVKASTAGTTPSFPAWPLVTEDT